MLHFESSSSFVLGKEDAIKIKHKLGNPAGQAIVELQLCNVIHLGLAFSTTLFNLCILVGFVIIIIHDMEQLFMILKYLITLTGPFRCRTDKITTLLFNLLQVVKQREHKKTKIVLVKSSTRQNEDTTRTSCLVYCLCIKVNFGNPLKVLQLISNKSFLLGNKFYLF